MIKKEFTPKRAIQIEEVNLLVNTGGLIEKCEREYTERISAVADRVVESEVGIVLASGPSASGKTTSSLRLARELTRRGHKATVISLDDFFKNIEQYPKFEDGTPDMESVYCVDIELVNKSLAELASTGMTDIPQFDFIGQHRSDKTKRIDLTGGGVAIIEGIHALNPIMSESLEDKMSLKLYVGLREEYYIDDYRILPTRDLRIIRRLVRDRLFRGYSAEQTLDTWDDIIRGEDVYIKPFKAEADLLLDTSHTFEPCLFAPIVAKIRDDASEGGAYRDRLEKLDAELDMFVNVYPDELSKDSLMREFVGGLEL